MTDKLDKALTDKAKTSIEILEQAKLDYQRVTFANSLGAEDVVITHMIATHKPDIDQFMLDTGRLPEETLELLAEISKTYDLDIQVYFPDASQIESWVRKNGINAFYESQELRKACCHIRKVEPLKRALKGYKAWITGLRRSQSVTRGDMKNVTWDEGNGLYKVSPLLDWTESDVWDYIRHHNIPYNKLHDQHYPSIGCAPCTRAIAVGEDVRAGRWWWENEETKECGLHIIEK